MKKIYPHPLSFARTLVALLLCLLTYNTTATAQGRCVAAADGCPGADLSNSFLNSSNPATIEYDNIVSTFHSTMARQSDGRVLIWGETTASDGTNNLTSPHEVNSTNFPGLTGDILRFAAGSDFNTEDNGITAKSQFIVLTTDGIFVWGGRGILINSELTTSKVFQKLTVNGKPDGLPPGVTPSMVKSLFGSFNILGLVTCNGDAWTLVNAGNAAKANAYGDGSTYSLANNQVWHRVKTNATTNLNNVVALRGSGCSAFVALTSDGSMWTWGINTLLGNGNAAAHRAYATQMALPSGVTPKMIGMIGSYQRSNNSSYHLLSTSGNVYGLGLNHVGQLGDFTTTNNNNWVQVQRSATAGDYLTGITWISPGEHDLGNYPALNALSSVGELWSWGSNNQSLLGQAASTFITPTLNTGGLAGTDRLLAVETGGHTTIVVRQCEATFGYVGHKIYGSMGDGTQGGGAYPTFTFNTSELDLCAAPGKAKISSTDTLACAGTPYTVTGNHSTGTFSVITGNATIGAASGVLNVTGAGDIRVVYSNTAFSCAPTTDTLLLRQRDMGNLDPAIYPVASASTTASNSAWLGIGFPTSDCDTKLADEADGLAILSGATPVTGSGTQASPWQLAGGQNYTFNVTVNGNGTPKPVYWAIWYDVNGDGDFTDPEDIFQTGNTTHGSPATASVGIVVPAATTTGGSNGAIRVAATAESTTFTKQLNGTVSLLNGEIEDFFVSYPIPLPVTLTDFTAIARGSAVVLNWTTTSETNNRGFEIQRSSDGENWQRIAFTDALNTPQGGNYQYLDRNPLVGVNYYRLKQIDIDNRYTYTNIRKVTFGNTAGAITIYPNPVRDNVWIEGLTGRVEIKVYNSIGALLKIYQVNGENIQLDMSTFKDGIYQLHIADSNGRLLKTAKIAKLK